MILASAEPALVVGRDSFGFASLDAAREILAVRAWGEATGGTTESLPDELLPFEALVTAPGGEFPRLVAFDEALRPYSFLDFYYDPVEAVSASLDRARGQGAGVVVAVWAAMEADLFRFAFDSSCTAALESARGSKDWYRFARLNDLYRALIRAIAPFGIVPGAWSAWLRGGDAYSAGRSRWVERWMTRGLGAVALALKSWAREPMMVESPGRRADT